MPTETVRVKGRMARWSETLLALKPGDPPVSLDDNSAAERRAIYQVAQRHQFMVSIRTTKRGGKVWRLT